MSNISPVEFESLISISSNEDSFYVLVSTTQSLYFYLKNNYSRDRTSEYFKLLAHLLENHLNPSKKKSLHTKLIKMIIGQSRDEVTARYFYNRFSRLDILKLLEYHHNLTGNLLVLANVDYSEENFKIKQVHLSKKSSSVK